MNIQQQAETPAPPAWVWEFLQQPDRLVRVLPACVGVKAGDDGSLVATFDVHAAGLHERFDAHFTRFDERPPESFRVRVKAATRMGRISGEGGLRLEPIERGTRILVAGEAQVSGLLALLGNAVAGSLAEQALKKALDAIVAELPR